jgi:hypothetical protein
VNVNRQKVQILIFEKDGRIKGDFILDKCSVVDGRNWKCDETGKLSVRDYGMVRGRFYTSSPPDDYTSSISGLAFWALHYGLITWPTALSQTGYSDTLIAESMRRTPRG